MCHSCGGESPLKVSECGQIRKEDDSISFDSIRRQKEHLNNADLHHTRTSNNHDQRWRNQAFGLIST